MSELPAPPARSSVICVVCEKSVEPYRHQWLFRCDACGTLRSNLAINIPDEPTSAVLDEGLREQGLERIREINNAILLQTLFRRAPLRARLLDVGSGPGFLLRQAEASGFRALGLEPDANTAGITQAAGLDVRQGYFPQALSTDERFDAIVFNDVLEHIPAVDEALSACFRHLEPGGLLCLNCPDRNGLFFRTADVLDRIGICGPYERLWQKGLPSPHVWYFTSRDLARACVRHGFEKVAQVRLETIDLDGLWARIRYVRGQSLAMSMASYLFALGSYPLSRLLPADSIALILRKC